MKLGKLLLGIWIALLAACGGDKGTASGALRVGVVLPMTGNTATYGEESWNGILLAKDDLKGQGIEFDLRLKDEKSDSQTANLQTKTLVENEGANVILGSVASSNTLQIMLAAKESGIPVITPASTNDTLTEKGGPLASRICFNDSFQGAVLANFALTEGWKNGVAVVDRAQVYSTGLAENIQKTFEEGGGTLAFEYYTSGDTDFANAIQNVANHKPQVIFFSGYYPEGGVMIRQAGDKWKGVPLVAGDGFDSPELPKLVGDTSADIFLSSHFAADAPDAAVQDFAKRYEKRFGQLPGAMAGLGYDVLMVLADAVKRCKDPKDPEELGKAIAATKYKGITGFIDLTTPDRTPKKDAVIVKVGGGLKFYKVVPAK
ncbi:MAG TPA: ABC transporter substrate-binding protein [Planctomycetota bacterium]|nr:ABC transporter substrate-binding protein [Planctomycetota bacterium]